jgi:hypothetical protein
VFTTGPADFEGRRLRPSRLSAAKKWLETSPTFRAPFQA